MSKKYSTQVIIVTTDCTSTDHTKWKEIRKTTLGGSISTKIAVARRSHDLLIKINEYLKRGM